MTLCSGISETNSASLKSSKSLVIHLWTSSSAGDPELVLKYGVHGPEQNVIMVEAGTG
jgi:L-lactate utilization protein LutC